MLRIEGDHPLRWVIELIGTVGGIAFVVSGVLNAITFLWVWRLNYFLIATPSDVVMSGFILVSIFSITIAVGGICLLLARYAARAYHRLLIRAAVDIKSDDPIERAKLLIKHRLSQTERAGVLINGAAAVASVASIIISLFVATNQTATAWKLTPFWYESGLNVAPTSSIAGGKCGGARVAWMGSSAAILECRDGIHVIHKLDDLETVRRY